MRQPTMKVSHESQLSEGHKIAEKINLEPVKLKKYGSQYLYYPSKISPDNVQYEYKNTEEYLNLNNYNPDFILQKPEYQKEELVFDKNNNLWKLVKEEDKYQYE